MFPYRDYSLILLNKCVLTNELGDELVELSHSASNLAAKNQESKISLIGQIII